jgi:hypothetical protein
MDKDIPSDHFWSKGEEEEAGGEKRKRLENRNRVDGDITDCD